MSGPFSAGLVPGARLREHRCHVSVPATSANLGAGFDCLGLALNLRDELTAQLHCSSEDEPLRVEVSVEGECAHALPTDASHFIAAQMLRQWDRQGVDTRGFTLRLQALNRIPHARGLGSSAAAIVGGLLLANELLCPEDQLGKEEIFQTASGIEGHPDNIAPALFGGVTSSWTQEDQVHTLSLDPLSSLQAVIGIPDQMLSTEKVRGLLPREVPYEDACFNVSRAALSLHALTRDPELLFSATEDRLHQHYRGEAMPSSAQAVARLRDEGIAAVISGAGPTVMALVKNEDQALRACEEFTLHSMRVLTPAFSSTGAMVRGS